MTGDKIPQEKVDRILNAINLSASSLGLQPYKILVIKNKDLKQELLPAANNQPQIVECSHLLVFAAYSNLSKEHAEEFIQLQSRVKNIAPEKFSGLKNMIVRNIIPRGDETNFIWASKQAYIALGTGLIASAEEQVDSTPMEGFNSLEFDRILQLDQKGLKSLVLLALGYRDETTDQLSKGPKVRKNISDLIIKVN